jgi:hypothetical protein
MMDVKYIVADGRAIVFSAAIQHSDMARGFGEVEGAGFVTFRTKEDEYGETIVTSHCYGESISLGIKSRGEIDSKIVTRQITNPNY